ncbi:MAG: phage tail tape measure protein [Hyphomicrobiaceae bacterium]|nr:phage tail tape measure protein [Hyphomicrobiaceae bacterium]
MAGIGDIRGRVVITNAASGTLQKIQRDLGAVGKMTGRTTLGAFSANALSSVTLATDRLQRSIMGLRTALLGSGMAFAGIIQGTKTFNESKFGYGFARITDFIKDGKLQLEEWKRAVNAAANEARDKAESLGLSPNTTMRATEETEKLGFTGRTALAVRNSALGLHMSEPMELDPGEAAKFLGAVLRGYRKQMEAQARSEGVDPANADAMATFTERYVKGLAAKAALAGSASALGPADVIEGMRQFAPQWAAMGIPYEFALAGLAHGSNQGFRAPEMGTSYKSMVNKTLNPTPTALRLLNNLGVDRSKYMTTGPADPVKATQRLNNLLDGQLFSGKGGKKRREEWNRNLRAAHDRGELTSPEFQQLMTQKALAALGKGWEGRADDVRLAVANATMVPGGSMDLPGYIKALRDAGASVSDILQIFEGRHIARNLPMFQFMEDLVALLERLRGVDGSMIDAVEQGRKESEAGKTDSLMGSLQNLLISLEQTGPVQAFKSAIDSLADALRGMPSGILATFTASVLGIGAAAGGLAVLSRTAKVIAALLGFAATLGPAAAGAAAAGTATATGTGAAIGGGIAGGVVAGAHALRAGLAFVPGWGWVAVGALTAGLAAWQAWQYYQEKGAEAAPTMPELPALPPGTMFPLAGADTGFPPLPTRPGAGNATPMESEAQRSAAAIRQALDLDLTAAGVRAGETFAAGLRQGMASAVSAAQNAAAQVRGAASNTVPLNTGPSMRGAN